jgi:hypothetical protein
MEHLALLPQGGAGSEHGSDLGLQPRSVSEQFQYPRLEGGDGDRTKLEPERFERAAGSSLRPWAPTLPPRELVTEAVSTERVVDASGHLNFWKATEL